MDGIDRSDPRYSGVYDDFVPTILRLYSHGVSLEQIAATCKIIAEANQGAKNIEQWRRPWQPSHPKKYMVRYILKRHGMIKEHHYFKLSGKWIEYTPESQYFEDYG